MGGMTVGQFAKTTSVPIDRSRAEIERELQRYGATGFAYATEGSRAMIQFKIQNRVVSINLPLPKLESDLFTPTRVRYGVSKLEVRKQKWDQACRSCWRALLLVIKAKLEAVACGISTIEREFLVDLLLPNGETVGQVIQPQIEQSYKDGKMPPLLGMGH